MDALERDELAVDQADRARDLLERLVDGGDVRQQHDQQARLQLSLDDEVEAVPEDDGRSRRGDRVDDEAEERLSHSELHPLVDRGLPLLSEPPELVPLSAERHDHPQHGHRLVHDRERLPLEPLHALEPRNDALAVQAGRVVEERHDEQAT